MFCGTLGYYGTPVDEYWARLYGNLFWRAQIQLHIY